MHDSVKRLLDFARESTALLPPSQRVSDFAGIGARLGASSAVLTNWKQRGISKEGALDAQREFGCNAWWLMTGEGPSSVATTAIPGISSKKMASLDQTQRELLAKLMQAALQTIAPDVEPTS